MTVLLKIEGAMTLYEAASFRNQLIECLEADDSLTLNLEAVNKFDTAGVQLLYSALKTAQVMGKTIAIQNPSSKVIEFMRRSGMDLTDIVNKNNLYRNAKRGAA